MECLQDAMGGMFTGCNEWDVYKIENKFRKIFKCLFHNEVK